MQIIIPKRHIELKIISKEDDIITFCISKQSHRCDSFNPAGNSKYTRGATNVYTLACIDLKKSRTFITPKSKYILTSYCFPQVGDGINLLYVRGEDESSDDDKLQVTKEHFDEIEKAVNEYNRTFEKDIVIEEGAMYHYASRRGNILNTIWHSVPFKGFCLIQDM